MSSKVEKKQFEDNFNKLESLSQELQDNKISIDQLVSRMKDALAAFKVCKNVLSETKVQLTEITAEFSAFDEDSLASDGATATSNDDGNRDV